MSIAEVNVQVNRWNLLDSARTCLLKELARVNKLTIIIQIGAEGRQSFQDSLLLSFWLVWFHPTIQEASEMRNQKSFGLGIFAALALACLQTAVLGQTANQSAEMKVANIR